MIVYSLAFFSSVGALQRNSVELKMSGIDDTVVTGLSSANDHKRYQTTRNVVITVVLFVLLLTYLCVGAAIFAAIEGREPDDVNQTVADNIMTREMLVDRLVELGSDPNATKADYKKALDSYGNSHGNYYEYWHQWSYEMSLFYCFKLLTTIGYGNITPVTTAGKLLSILYAFFGIILLLSFFVKFGSILAKELNKLYKRLRLKMSKRSGLGYKREDFETNQLADDGTDEDPRAEGDAAASPEDIDVEEDHQDPIPFWAITIFAAIFLLIFASLMYALEDWTYVDAVYYSFMSLATVGFGDLIPEKNLLGCTILIANAFVVVSTLICLGYTSVMRVLRSFERLIEKAILKCTP